MIAASSTGAAMPFSFTVRRSDSGSPVSTHASVSALSTISSLCACAPMRAAVWTPFPWYPDPQRIAAHV